MLKFATFVLVLFTLLSTYALAQGPCPTLNQPAPNLTLSHDLICTIPQVYGPGGMVGVQNGGPLGSTDTSSAAFKHSFHFQNSAVSILTPLTNALTGAIGTQLSQLPPSPAPGFIFSFNPSLGVELAAARNLGPILSERADTLGKHKLFVGVSYQYFDFDKVDGVNLRGFGAVFQHEPENCPSPYDPTIVTCFNNGAGPPVVSSTYISTQNSIHLKVHQITAVATFGVTDRFDLSVAAPILNVRMDMTSFAIIHNFEATDATIRPQCCVHQFAPPPAAVPGETLGPLVTAPSNGFQFYGSASFLRANTASGIGDFLFRGKYEVFKGEKLGVAVGADLRIPTGDELNFLGSGTWGMRPFGAFSYSGRFSPHASLGYEVNGKSVLGGDISSYTAARLPDVFNYSVGADYGVSTRFSLSGDFLGQTLRNVTRIATTQSETLFANNQVVPAAGLLISRGTLNQASIAVGGKISAFGRMLIIVNVLFRLNDAGLRYKPVPLAGLAYTF